MLSICTGDLDLHTYFHTVTHSTVAGACMTSTHTSTQANDDSSCLRRCKHPSQTSKNNDAAFRLCTCCRWELTQRQRRSACKQQAESVGRPDRMRLIKLAIMCLIKLAIATSSRTEVHASYDEHKTVHIAQECCREQNGRRHSQTACSVQNSCASASARIRT